VGACDITSRFATTGALFFADDLVAGASGGEGAGLYLDYSKQRVTDETLMCLLELAAHRDLRGRIELVFRGEKVNLTEQRAALHIALRAPRGTSIVVDGENVVPHVHAVLDRMADFCSRVRSGTWTGHTGRRITT
jgi:glucose-6-phosphate isomerase